MRKLHPEAGYVFVAADEDGPMCAAEPGKTVSVAGRGPPWIVVAWDFSSVMPTWPGRLWRVRIADAATPMDQARHGGQPLRSARYTRAVSVLVEREEDAARLFGDFGGEVVRVLDTGVNLDRLLAESLAANRHPGAAGARDRAWRVWLDRLGAAHDDRSDLSDTLKLGGPVCDSPIGDGLMVLHDVVFTQARAIDGDGATDNDEEDVWLLPPWDGAFDALADAALALGAPDIVPPDDRVALLAGWQSIAAARPDDPSPCRGERQPSPKGSAG